MYKKVICKKSIVSLILLPVLAINTISPIIANGQDKVGGVGRVEELLSNDDILDIRNIDDSAAEEVNINSKNANLPDGKYILNRGTGWVLENDESLIKTAHANPGITLSIEESVVKIKEKSVTAGISAELGNDILKASVEREYGRVLRSEETIRTSFSIDAPSDKAIYAKLYGTYNRFDLIQVKNNKITGKRSTYEPEGSWLKYIKYTKGEQVDQSQLIEKNTRCVLGEKEEINIKSSIKVGGTTPAGAANEAFSLALDFDANRLLFLNRNNGAIHAGFGDNKYFEFRLLDKAKNEKVSIQMVGNDRPDNKKYDKLGGFSFEIGDYIEVYHKEPFRLSYSNLTGSTQLQAATQIYEITSNGLKEKEYAKNNIAFHVNGFKAFDLEFDYKTKNVEFKNRSDRKISESSNQHMLTIRLMDKNYKNKHTMIFRGSDKASDTKYNLPNGLKFEIGDRIRISAENPLLLTFTGYIQGGASTYLEQSYEIGNDGFIKIF